MHERNDALENIVRTHHFPLIGWFWFFKGIASITHQNRMQIHISNSCMNNSHGCFETYLKKPQSKMRRTRIHSIISFKNNQIYEQTL